MRRCELCKAKARMHCASDQASLCWDCDAAVHSANFLVARHSRNLLCDVCQSPTPWSASGGKLRSTVSVCEQCADQEPCDDSSEDESVEEELEEDNQVVPWSPPPEESSSSADESVGGRNVVVSRKRFRIESRNPPMTETLSSSKTAPRNPPMTETLSSSKTAPTQKVQIMDSGRVEIRGSVVLEIRESGVLESLRRLHREDTGSGREMAEFHYLSGPSI